MKHRVLFAMALLGGCGSTTDDRPATAEVVSLEILAPTCGQVQCHSTTTYLVGYAFDTFEASRVSLRDMGVTQSPTNNDLWWVIQDNTEDPMPPDYPLATQDIALIKKWLDAGAPGVK